VSIIAFFGQARAHACLTTEIHSEKHGVVSLYRLVFFQVGTDLQTG